MPTADFYHCPAMRREAYTRQLLHDLIEWDVASWKQALAIWDAAVPHPRGLRVLEVGSRNGGVSLYWALKGCEVVCSDRGGPTEAARRLHARYGVADRVAYEAVDATKMPFDAGGFDVVCFKSVLGGIGAAMGPEGQRQALREMHRVLRPGGRLLFAENTTASPLHALLRRRLVAWGTRWRYVPPSELPELLEGFENVRLEYAGFLATFGRREWQRTALHGLDRVLVPIVPESWRYIVFGRANKPIA
ncbi:MAG: hypothetical protein AMXMBFR83_30570 [Phycisphaerae bacterium]